MTTYDLVNSRSGNCVLPNGTNLYQCWLIFLPFNWALPDDKCTGNIPLQNVATYLVYVVSVKISQHIEAEMNGRHVVDDIFKCIFLNESVWFLIKMSLKFVPRGLINNSLCSDNGLVPSRRQAIIWTNDG